MDFEKERLFHKQLLSSSLLQFTTKMFAYTSKREYVVGEHHKIKTDTGIEISFPVEYLKNREFIEIKTNDDGTLRIELKNINKIVNK